MHGCNLQPGIKKGHTRKNYIHYTGKSYHIKNNGKYYGAFKTYQEAYDYVCELIETGEIVPMYNRPDRYLHRLPSGHYSIIKRINGTNQYFGTFNSLENARAERDFLENIGWDYDNM